MKKMELLGLGLTPEQVKTVMCIHSEDMSNLRLKQGKSMEREGYINAITNMLPLIKRRDDLKQIIALVNRLYYLEARSEEENTEENSSEEGSAKK